MQLTIKEVQVLLNVLRLSETNETSRKDACKLFQFLADPGVELFHKQALIATIH